MNTSGPSSRPRKPYPFALLNHLTVPFRRSTFAPLLILLNSPERRDSGGQQKKCVGIVLLAGGTVKARGYLDRAVARAGQEGIYYRLAVWPAGSAFSASQRTPQRVLASRIRPLSAIRFASVKLKNLTAILSSGSGWASPG